MNIWPSTTWWVLVMDLKTYIMFIYPHVWALSISVVPVSTGCFTRPISLRLCISGNNELKHFQIYFCGHS